MGRNALLLSTEKLLAVIIQKGEELTRRNSVKADVGPRTLFGLLLLITNFQHYIYDWVKVLVTVEDKGRVKDVRQRPSRRVTRQTLFITRHTFVYLTPKLPTPKSLTISEQLSIPQLNLGLI